MNCHRCGNIMILKKFYDYGGYTWGWKCTFCKEIIDQTQESRLLPKEEAKEYKIGRRPYPVTLS